MREDMRPDDLNFWDKKMFDDVEQKLNSMKKEKVVDRRRVTLDNSNKDYIPFLGGRPERQTIITQDDITNLVISLGISCDVNEVIAMC